jgi:hypothetical protein
MIRLEEAANVVVRIIVQKNANGEKHVTLTQDQLTPVEEMLVGSDSEWQDAEVIEGRVLLVLGMDEPDCILDELLDTELHTAWTQHRDMPISSALLDQLRENQNEAV